MDIPVTGKLRVNSPEATRELVNAGVGIAQGPEWLYEAGLSNGNLKLILQEFYPPPVPIQFVYIADRLMPKRALVFMEFIAEAFANSSVIDERHASP